MEKIELFLYDIFGNFIPGCLLNLIVFSEVKELLNLNDLDKVLESKILLGAFLLISYILGNLLNLVSHEFFTQGGRFGIRNDINTEREVMKLKKKLSLRLDCSNCRNTCSNNIPCITYDAYDIAKKYIEKENQPNLIRKFETKYLFYRNLTVGLFYVYFYNILMFLKEIIFFGGFSKIKGTVITKFVIIGSLIIWASFREYKYYWGKSKEEMLDSLLLIRKKEDATMRIKLER